MELSSVPSRPSSAIMIVDLYLAQARSECLSDRPSLSSISSALPCATLGAHYAETQLARELDKIKLSYEIEVVTDPAEATSLLMVSRADADARQRRRIAVVSSKWLLERARCDCLDREVPGL